MLTTPLLDTERAVLRRRTDDLNAALDRRDPAMVLRAVGDMCRKFGVTWSEQETALRMREYADVLVGFPAWAVHAVCGRYARGEVGERDNEFIPPPAAVAELCAAEIGPSVEERNRIVETLTAKAREVPQRTPEALARADALVAEFRRGAGGPSAKMPGPHSGKPAHPYIEKYHADRAKAVGDLGASQALRDILDEQARARA